MSTPPTGGGGAIDPLRTGAADARSGSARRNAFDSIFQEVDDREEGGWWVVRKERQRDRAPPVLKGSDDCGLRLLLHNHDGLSIRLS